MCWKYFFKIPILSLYFCKKVPILSPIFLKETTWSPVFMTVVMNRHNNTVGEVNDWYKTPGKTKPESEIMFGRWGNSFPLAFSPCGVQRKLRFLLSFGFIVSLLFYFVYTHWNYGCVSKKISEVRFKTRDLICKLILKYMYIK